MKKEERMGRGGEGDRERSRLFQNSSPHANPWKTVLQDSKNWRLLPRDEISYFWNIGQNELHRNLSHQATLSNKGIQGTSGYTWKKLGNLQNSKPPCLELFCLTRWIFGIIQTCLIQQFLNPVVPLSDFFPSNFFGIKLSSFCNIYGEGFFLLPSGDVAPYDVLGGLGCLSFWQNLRIPDIGFWKKTNLAKEPRVKECFWTKSSPRR